MRLKIDNLEIENKHLNSVSWVLREGHTLRFSGVALEDEGKGICDRLSEFKKGQIVEVEAETRSYELFEGICEIDEITIPPPEVDKAPAIYRFHGYLKRVE